MRVHDEAFSDALGQADLAAKRAEFARLRDERGTHPDERLDALGWEIFRMAVIFGAERELAADMALSGTLRQREAVLRDFLRRYPGRFSRLDGLKPPASRFLLTSDEHLAYWRQELDRPSFVYFIQAGETGPVKIGRAVDPERRIAQIQTGSPDQLHLRAVVPGANREEAKMHQRFADERIRGEWFGIQYLPVILSYAHGIADAAYRSYDQSGQPPVLTYRVSNASAEADVRELRNEIEELWKRGHSDQEIQQFLHLEPAEYDDHVADMRASTLYDLPRWRNGRFFPLDPMPSERHAA